MAASEKDRDPYAIVGITAGWVDDKQGENPTGEVPLRLEVDDWYPNPKETDDTKREMYFLQHRLFFTALSIFQAMDPRDDMSYFGVAGIHGYPLEPWKEKSYPADERDDGQTAGGYCTHGSILFPTWHRPYLLLFEQRLYEIMNTEIIPYLKLPGEDNNDDIGNVGKKLRAEFQKAADHWRLPYWDWAKTRGTNKNLPHDLPEIVKHLKVPGIPLKGQVFDPLNGDFTIDNPMYKYTLPEGFEGTNMRFYKVDDLKDNALAYKTDDAPPVKVQGNYPFGDSKGTSRWQPFQEYRRRKDKNEPKQIITQEWINGTCDFEMAKAGLNGILLGPNLDDPVKSTYNLKRAVEKLLSPNFVQGYAQFATTRYRETNKSDMRGWLSLEQIHNAIHVRTGGRGKFMGHMSEVPVAAFDPIFWLHHSNCDRLLAIWLELRRGEDEAWFDPKTKNINEEDQVLREKEGSWSFKKGDYVDNRTGLAPFCINTDGKLWTSEDAREHKKWGYTYPELQDWLDIYKNKETGEFDHALYVKGIEAQVSELYGDKKAKARASDTDISGLKDSTKLEDYIIAVQYKKYALRTPYSILLFLQPPKTPENPQPGKILLGDVYSFTNRSVKKCANCVDKDDEENRGMWSQASISINDALFDRIEEGDDPLKTLKREEVKPYLEKNLSWVVMLNSGDIVPMPKKNPFVEIKVAVGDKTVETALGLKPVVPIPADGVVMGQSVPVQTKYIKMDYSDPYVDLGLELAESVIAMVDEIGFAPDSDEEDE